MQKSQELAPGGGVHRRIFIAAPVAAQSGHVGAVPAGDVAVVVDLDPQGSASVWSDLREADQPVVVSAHAPRIGRMLDAARARGVGLVVIDTAPHASDAAFAAARAADLV